MTMMMSTVICCSVCGWTGTVLEDYVYNDGYDDDGDDDDYILMVTMTVMMMISTVINFDMLIRVWLNWDCA